MNVKNTKNLSDINRLHSLEASPPLTLHGGDTHGQKVIKWLGHMLLWICLGNFYIAGCAVHAPAPCWKNGRLYGTTNDWIVRHDWDSSYRRGLSYSEGECWEQAISQFLLAIRQRSDDQWRARSYGMIVLDEYFPHRELGIVYLQLGQVEDAIHELSLSLDSADSAKTKYYLNKAHRRWLEETDLDQTPPKIRFLSHADKDDGPGDLLYTNRSFFQVEGLATDDYFVASLCINEKPILFDLALPELSFEEKVALKSGINFICGRVTDLVGHQYEEKIKIFLDQQGPMVIFNPVADDEFSHHQPSIKRIKGLIFDSGGLDKLIIGGEEILVRGEKIQEFEVDIFSLHSASDHSKRGASFRRRSSLSPHGHPRETEARDSGPPSPSVL